MKPLKWLFLCFIYSVTIWNDKFTFSLATDKVLQVEIENSI